MIKELYYKVYEWLTDKLKKKEIKESFKNGQWHRFTCYVRWDREKQTIEMDAPQLTSLPTVNIPTVWVDEPEKEIIPTVTVSYPEDEKYKIVELPDAIWNEKED